MLKCHNLFIILVLFFISSCHWGPKEKEVKMPGLHSTGEAYDSGLYFDLHRVKTLEILQSDTYVYLLVSEDKRTFWIATRPSDFHKDSIYYYEEALLKKEFESKQLNRVFDSLYLVTKLVPELHHLEQVIQ